MVFIPYSVLNERLGCIGQQSQALLLPCEDGNDRERERNAQREELNHQGRYNYGGNCFPPWAVCLTTVTTAPQKVSFWTLL